MQTQHGKMTSKGQTTIPAVLRRELGLNPGDDLIFRIEDDTLIIKKAGPLDMLYYRVIQSGLETEWNSKEDSEAFDDL